jgi:hypothetical protein
MNISGGGNALSVDCPLLLVISSYSAMSMATTRPATDQEVMDVKCIAVYQDFGFLADFE